MCLDFCFETGQNSPEWTKPKAIYNLAFFSQNQPFFEHIFESL